MYRAVKYSKNVLTIHLQQTCNRICNSSVAVPNTDLSVVYGLLGWLGAAVAHMGPHAPHRLNIPIEQNSTPAMYVCI